MDVRAARNASGVPVAEEASDGVYRVLFEGLESALALGLPTHDPRRNWRPALLTELMLLRVKTLSVADTSHAGLICNGASSSPPCVMLLNEGGPACCNCFDIEDACGDGSLFPQDLPSRFTLSLAPRSSVILRHRKRAPLTTYSSSATGA
jgi:hypothetical protein